MTPAGDDLVRALLWAGIEDHAPLWQAGWELNSLRPDVPQDENRRVARRILRELIEKGHMRLVREEAGKEDVTPLPSSTFLAELADESNWEPRAFGEAGVALDTTEAGEAAYNALVPSTPTGQTATSGGRTQPVSSDRVCEFTEHVLAASTSSIVLPAETARVLEAQPTADNSRLVLTLEIDGGRYRYRWPKSGTIDTAVDGWKHGSIESWTTVVLANVCELLEAVDFGLAWAIEHGALEPLHDEPGGRTSPPGA